MLIKRGGKEKERLYLHNLVCHLDGDTTIEIKRTNLPDMKNLIARHIARYLLSAFFVRPGMRVLDFPCGSGYGSEILTGCGDVEYIGMDNDVPTLEYCKRENIGTFIHNDLIRPILKINYDVIACIEGIEHIERKYQVPLIGSFLNALKPGGILVISTPEKSETPQTPYHLCELSEHEFKSLLTIPLVGFENVQILNHKEQGTNWLYGICRKGD